MTQIPLKQSDHSFTVGPRFQTVWGIREAIVFALEGLAVGAFLLFAATDHVTGMIGALICMIGAVILLLSHLGKPMLALRAIINVRRSWISRGTLAIGLFTALGCLYVGGLTIPALSFIDNLNDILILGAVVTGLFILFYPGLAMRASAGIAFWSSPLLPLLSFLHGSLTGLMAAGVVFGGQVAILGVDLKLVWAAFVIVIAFITFLYVHAMRRRSNASTISANWLIGQEPLLFWTLAMGLGLLLPLIAILLGLSNTPVLAGIVLGRIMGDIAFRFAVLKVGAFESVA